ncbi:unnamed protein product [Oppiella nova]|uniref:Uncharacterized protein n=1 Tax=Oppiella nova TaxID=334625 RepID=A0A7R9M211_9ACAR|nr:unnamed protein product [Oppiella nova]CAG2169234.1 unnamed protein product [Oppiella nova]
MNIAYICCGGWHSLALTTDGKVYGWGDNTFGQIGFVWQLIVTKLGHNSHENHYKSLFIELSAIGSGGFGTLLNTKGKLRVTPNTRELLNIWLQNCINLSAIPKRASSSISRKTESNVSTGSAIPKKVSSSTSHNTESNVSNGYISTICDEVRYHIRLHSSRYLYSDHIRHHNRNMKNNIIIMATNTRPNMTIISRIVSRQ